MLEERGRGVNIFANGGDRVKTNTPERQWCEKRGITMVYGAGGPKVQSSSALLKRWTMGS